MKVYLYGTLGHLGGATMKIRHLLRLLCNEVDFTVILTHPCWRRNKERIYTSWGFVGSVVSVLSDALAVGFLNLKMQEFRCLL